VKAANVLRHGFVHPRGLARFDAAHDTPDYQIYDADPNAKVTAEGPRGEKAGSDGHQTERDDQKINKTEKNSRKRRYERAEKHREKEGEEDGRKRKLGPSVKGGHRRDSTQEEIEDARKILRESARRFG
jgi:hypothetical protein